MKPETLEKISKLDRRWIFLLVAVFVVVPLIIKLALPVNISPTVRSIYDDLSELPKGSTVLIACDYDPASEAELYPMQMAIMRHCFDKGHKVLAFTLWPNGAALIDRAFNTLQKEYKIERGVDFINFGYAVGGAIVILQAGQNMKAAFPSDFRGKPTATMPAMENIETYDDIAYVIDLAAGSTIDWWVGYGVERYGFKLGAGCTAVSATQYYPYINTGQITGLIGGLKGAAEYEALSGHKDRAIAGMSAQSSVHALIIVLVVLSNIFYFMAKRKG